MTKKEIIYKHTLENITYKNNKNILNYTQYPDLSF